MQLRIAYRKRFDSGSQKTKAETFCGGRNRTGFRSLWGSQENHSHTLPRISCIAARVIIRRKRALSKNFFTDKNIVFKPMPG